MPSQASNEATRAEWRALGFFYERDDEAREWRLIGARSGLLRFRELLQEYVADPRHARPPEHEHYGPYAYLKVMTWREAGLNGTAIYGPLPRLSRLATLVARKLLQARPGTVVRIQEEYGGACEYALVLEVREEGFDPAAADPMLPPEVVS